VEDVGWKLSGNGWAGMKLVEWWFEKIQKSCKGDARFHAHLQSDPM
jgi:hypothetical protein